MASAKDVDIRQYCQVSFGSRMSASFSRGQLFPFQQRGLQAAGAVRALGQAAGMGRARSRPGVKG